MLMCSCCACAYVCAQEASWKDAIAEERRELHEASAELSMFFSAKPPHDDVAAGLQGVDLKALEKSATVHFSANELHQLHAIYTEMAESGGGWATAEQITAWQPELGLSPAVRLFLVADRPVAPMSDGTSDTKPAGAFSFTEWLDFLSALSPRATATQKLRLAAHVLADPESGLVTERALVSLYEALLPNSETDEALRQAASAAIELGGGTTAGGLRFEQLEALLAESELEAHFTISVDVDVDFVAPPLSRPP